MTNLIDFTAYKTRQAVTSPEPEIVYEQPADTARKIREALKAEFPGIKFSVRTSTGRMASGVNVHWTDGPSQTAVEALLKCFESRDGQDRRCGYAWEGKLVYGARYLSASRTLSDARRKDLIAVLQMHEIGPYDRWGYTRPQFEQAELLLVDLQNQLAQLVQES